MVAKNHGRNLFVILLVSLHLLVFGSDHIFEDPKVLINFIQVVNFNFVSISLHVLLTSFLAVLNFNRC